LREYLAKKPKFAVDISNLSENIEPERHDDVVQTTISAKGSNSAPLVEYKTKKPKLGVDVSAVQTTISPEGSNSAPAAIISPVR
jgi:hypothetical protein